MAFDLLNEVGSSSDDEFRNMASSMRLKYKKYQGDVDKTNKLLYIGAILDPTVQLSSLQVALEGMYGKAMEETFSNRVRNALYDLFDDCRKMCAPLAPQSDQ